MDRDVRNERVKKWKREHPKEIKQIEQNYKKRNPKKYRRLHRKSFKKWYDGNTEIVVAVTCIFCGDIIVGRAGKKICEKCQLKWSRKVPQSVIDQITDISTINLSQDLLAWKRIMDYRNHEEHSLYRRIV